MRTTKDIIQQLQNKAQNAFMASIVVVFEKKTEFVWLNSANALGALDSLVKDGGEPVAFCLFERKGERISYRFEPLEEYSNEDWISGYLNALISNAMKALVAVTGCKVEDIQLTRPDLN